MAFAAILDACVLYPFSLRDTLLRLAERELYDAHWSEAILAEMTRNLIANRVMPADSAHRIARLMREAFDDATVPAEPIAQLEPSMTNHPKDRHVLAAAVVAHAGVIVTSNVRDFPADTCRPLGVEAVHPDDFLQILYAKDRAQVLHAVRQQAEDLTHPPASLDELLNMLSKTVPVFAAMIREDIKGRPDTCRT